jgi:phage terminase large subunit-like protein
VSPWPPAFLTKVSPDELARGDGPLAVQFVESLCPQVMDSVGGRAGAPLTLRPWQQTLLEHLYARRPDGRYRHRVALIGMPRKNGKSTIGSAGVALFRLFLGPTGGEVYSVAAEKEQARIVFGAAKRMIEASPELAEHAKSFKDAIEIPSTGSVYRCLSAESYSKEGLNPHCVVFDEVHAQPNRELWDVFSLAMAARTDALLVGITTAGVKADTTGQDSVAFDLYQYGQKVAKGEVDDPAFFLSWWQASPEADWRAPETWQAANPGYGDLQDPEDFAAAVRRTPEAEFRTKRLNQFVSSQQAWLPSGAWTELEHAEPPEGKEVPVVLGFDGSFSGDASVVVGVTIEEEPRVWLIRAWEKQPTDRDDWRVDISEVEAEIVKACQRWQVVEVACDPYRWQRSMEALEAQGIPITEFASSSPARMVPACAKFYDAVMSGTISHDHSPLMERHLSNAVLKVDRLGPRIVKEHKSSPRKIDAAVSAIIAFDRATSTREIEKPKPVPMFYG